MSKNQRETLIEGGGELATLSLLWFTIQIIVSHLCSVDYILEINLLVYLTRIMLISGGC